MVFWKINDGRVWSAEQAVFVSEESVINEDVVELMNGGLPASIDYLRDTIRFYGYPLGVLKDSQARREEILSRLIVLDTDSVRPTRAISIGKSSQADLDKLSAIESEATKLRLELAGLK